MMNPNTWLTQLQHNPILALLASSQKALVYYTQKDLLEQEVEPIEYIQKLPDVQKILRKQQADGSWRGKDTKQNPDCGVNYALIETWKQSRFLIDQYGLGRKYPPVEAACEYLFSCQTEEGDIRGMLANQFAPYYTGSILALLIKAGYGDDLRIEKGMQWLLSMRQDDGGWVIGSPGVVGMPALSWKELSDLTFYKTRETMRAFDKAKPFSAAGTGMALRAFAAHPGYCRSAPAIKAAQLLKSKFFKPDNWSWYQHPDNWIRFQFPFWWNNLVAALDTISQMGFSKDDAEICQALQWLVEHQETTGRWRVSYSRIHKTSEKDGSEENQGWITLAICRVFKRFYG